MQQRQIQSNSTSSDFPIHIISTNSTTKTLNPYEIHEKNQTDEDEDEEHEKKHHIRLNKKKDKNNSISQTHLQEPKKIKCNKKYKPNFRKKKKKTHRRNHSWHRGWGNRKRNPP
eukprot:TRINITY_DN4628_c0_g2_i1.p1 TRINITY_DN4628_c0_g2~~TRINITY_DN4628_c0_g2_i1.p1  ORF type:complete len:114 (-),score=9.98 TRINITY_DN4628_c0_g2_i1:770-1111(-)